MDIAVESFKLTNQFPTTEKFGIVSQITRAGVSIPANIAEGSSRTSEKDYGRVVEISLGAAAELETHLLIAQELEFGEKSKLNRLLETITDEQKMLIGFLQKLSR